MKFDVIFRTTQCKRPKPESAHLGVAGLGRVPGTLLGEADAEHAQNVAVRGLDVHVGLDQRLPLAHQRPNLVRRERHALHTY